MLDRGCAFGTSITGARRVIPTLLNDPANELSEMARHAIAELWDLLCELDRRITAIVAAIGDGKEFRNDRHRASRLGLIPHQHPSGDKRPLLSLSTHVSQHLRTRLVHGARAVVRTAPNNTDQLSTWVNDLRERRGYNRAAVAVANNEPLCANGSSTMASTRIIWALLRSGEPYRSGAGRPGRRLQEDEERDCRDRTGARRA